MFVISVKSSKIKVILFAIFMLLVLVASVLFFAERKNSSATTEGAISIRASDEKQRTQFLSQFGWDFDTEPVQVEEIIIPEEFDETYENYNELQKKQGFNLEDYKGANAKKWTYNINNFPDYENKKDYVQANIIVYNGNVIAADITVRGEKPQVYIMEFPKDIKNDTTT